MVCRLKLSAPASITSSRSSCTVSVYSITASSQVMSRGFGGPADIITTTYCVRPRRPALVTARSPSMMAWTRSSPSS